MAINFAAANMAGYNNPEVKIISMVLGSGGVPISTPSYDDISNICKSGELPVLYLSDHNHINTYILPLCEFKFYKQTAWMFTFRAIIQSGTIETSPPMVVSVYFKEGETPIIHYFQLPSPTA